MEIKFLKNRWGLTIYYNKKMFIIDNKYQYFFNYNFTLTNLKNLIQNGRSRTMFIDRLNYFYNQSRRKY